MNKIFEINDIKSLILSFIYPKKIKKGMNISLIERGRLRYREYKNNIFKIIKIKRIWSKTNFSLVHTNDKTLTLVCKRIQPNILNNHIFYIYPNNGDRIKVINSFQ